MIYGIGTDIQSIERIRAVWEAHGERFARRILGPEEMKIFERRSGRLSSRGIAFLATRFAAKEALSKALGLGMRMPMTWSSIQVLKAASGKPVAVPRGALAEWMTERRLTAQITLSDEEEYAVAFAVVEQEEA